MSLLRCPGTAQLSLAPCKRHEATCILACPATRPKLHGRPATAHSCRVRPHGRHRHRCCQAAAQDQAAAFTAEDLARIQREGPQWDEITSTTWTPRQEIEEGRLVEGDNQHTWVPREVFREAASSPAPRWRSLPQMQLAEFLHGLRQRNWTSPYHKPDAEPWQVDMRSGGFKGYRAAVTKPSGQRFWVDMPVAGADTFLHDQLAGGSVGGLYREKRVPEDPQSLDQYGYNQVFEQLFQAFEQRWPQSAEEQFKQQQWVDTSQFKYDCPGERQLQLSYHTAAPLPPAEASWKPRLMTLLGVVGPLTYMALVLALGIFRKQKVLPGDLSEAQEFAQSKGQAQKQGRTGVRFADVAGCSSVLAELKDVVEYLRNPERFSALGARASKGILLEGEPGTGKTLIAKAMAGEAGVPFYQMSGSEFVEYIVGVGAARIRDLFKRARAREEPCIIFVDEIDALGTKRAEAGERANEEREQALNQLLSEMDGFTPEEGIVFVAATNRADLLDPALMRAGRFDRKIRLNRPDAAAREEILRVHAAKRPLASDVDLSQLAKDLPGLSGAELANVLNEGALVAVRRGADVITHADVYDGVDRILQGIVRSGLREGLPSRRCMAIHEAGRALTATLLRQQALQAGSTPKLEAVERVSIIPRGSHWTRTTFYRGGDDSYVMATYSRLLQRLRVILAGRAAEQVLLEDGPTTYGKQDLREASDLAAKIVAHYGMTEQGLLLFVPHVEQRARAEAGVSIDDIDSDALVRNTAFANKAYRPGPKAVERTRMAAFSLVNAAYSQNLAELDASKDALTALSEALLSEQTLTGMQVEQIASAHPPEARPEVSKFQHAPQNGSNGATFSQDLMRAGSAQ